eukprot:scaffold35562_cov39-Phaeocystis_antarctica.AAC.1
MSAVLSPFCLAGAIATICALRLAMLGWKVELVTFGSPRVGNASFSSLVKKLVPKNARFVNPGDLVPSWPPLAFKFSHVGKKYALGQKNESVSDTEDADDNGYTPEKGTWCGGCIPKAKPPGKGGHGTALYVTNLLVPMNIKEFPPGFEMTLPDPTKAGEKHDLEIKYNIYGTGGGAEA